jgi:hypothetical protein
LAKARSLSPLRGQKRFPGVESSRRAWGGGVRGGKAPTAWRLEPVDRPKPPRNLFLRTPHVLAAEANDEEFAYPTPTNAPFPRQERAFYARSAKTFEAMNDLAENRPKSARPGKAIAPLPMTCEKATSARPGRHNTVVTLRFLALQPRPGSVESNGVPVMYSARD